MSQTYELTTIKDIFDKVPADRIELCCQELGSLMAQYKSLAEAMPEAGLLPEFPLKWIDDDKGEVSVSLHVRDAEGDLGAEVARFVGNVGGAQ